MSALAPSQTRRYDSTVGHDEGSEVAGVLKRVRERLVWGHPLASQVERSLLLRHAIAIRSGVGVMALHLLLAASGLAAFLDWTTAALWSLSGAVSLAALAYLAARLRVEDRNGLRAERWTRLFCCAHALAGLSWAGFAALGCTSCDPAAFDMLQVAVLLVGLAIVATLGSSLRHTVLLTFLPAALILALRATQAPDAALASALLIPAGAVPLFAIVADRLRAGARERFNHRVEKDALVAELEEARIASDEARRRAEDANHAKSRFLATMSHELRTPLNAILGFSEVITKEILGPVGNPTYREYVGDIHASGRHLLDLINEILDLSRVEAGRYVLNEEAVNLVAIAADCRSYLGLKAQAKSITIVTKLERGLPLLWGDPRALRQVVLNLLSNAVKFAPAGSEIVVRVGWTAGGGQYVSVADQGPGIPADEIPLVLSSFGQGSTAIKSAEQGSGLGLPIVQALVHLHGGELRLDSEAGRGTEALAIFPHSRVLEVMPAMTDYL
ncbi:sensor histidine kinase [Aureimonas mangrovi]|uniref:sensor histidine kinase n=1 Tax=Aureimonas mangrovi TaxID=2758041 RepID=UPI00163D3ECB|nr:HAMP domain-containing sensor histidine kinase [Aureimonas mangrovi]